MIYNELELKLTVQQHHHHHQYARASFPDKLAYHTLTLQAQFKFNENPVNPVLSVTFHEIKMLIRRLGLTISIKQREKNRRCLIQPPLLPQPPRKGTNYILSFGPTAGTT